MRSRSVPLISVLVLTVLSVAAPPAVAGGSCRGGEFTDTRTTEVEMTLGCFSPTVARVDPGDTVTFVNNDSMMHAVGGVTNVFGDMHTQVSAGKSVSYRFDEEGVYPYVCILHPGMGGALVVGDGEGKLTSAAAVPVDVAAPGAEAEAEAASAPVRSETRSSWWLPIVTAVVGAALALAFVWSRKRETPTTA